MKKILLIAASLLFVASASVFGQEQVPAAKSQTPKKETAKPAEGKTTTTMTQEAVPQATQQKSATMNESKSSTSGQATAVHHPVTLQGKHPAKTNARMGSAHPASAAQPAINVQSTGSRDKTATTSSKENKDNMSTPSKEPEKK